MALSSIPTFSSYSHHLMKDILLNTPNALGNQGSPRRFGGAANAGKRQVM